MLFENVLGRARRTDAGEDRMTSRTVNFRVTNRLGAKPHDGKTQDKQTTAIHAAHVQIGKQLATYYAIRP